MGGAWGSTVDTFFVIDMISMMASMMLTMVRGGFLALTMGISLDVSSFLAMGHLRVIRNVVYMLRLPYVLLGVKMLRPLIVVMMGFPIVGASRGLGQSFTGSTGFILVGMMMGFSMRSTLGSTRVLRFSKGVRSTISMRNITR